MKVGPLVALPAVVSLAVLAGCGTPASPNDSGPVKVAPASRGASDLPSKATLHTYFDAIANATVSSYDKALKVAAPGSPAAGFVIYLRAAADAVVDSGQEVDAANARALVKDGGFWFCNGSGSSRTCFRYTDITGADGKVVDFSVNGKPIADRVAVGSGTPAQLLSVDATARMVVAFESSAGDNLFVALEVKSGGQALDRVEASYTNADGSRVESARMSGPARLVAGETGSYVFAYPRAHIGGTLTLRLHGEAGAFADVDLPVRH
jgi:hypothetical protein